MRKNLIFLLLFPLLFACNKAPEGVVITGLIENFDGELFVMGGPGGSRDTILLDETGGFTYENAELEEPAQHYMILGEEYVFVWLENGMELDFYADMSNLKETMGFSGSGADINNYHSSKDTRAFQYTWYALEEDEFKFKADSLLALEQGNLNSAEKENPDDSYWDNEEIEIIYNWANNLENYPSAHIYYAKLDDFEVSDSFYDYRDMLDVNNPDNLASRAFGMYVSGIVRSEVSKKTKEILEADSTAEVDRHLMTLKTATEVLENEEVLNDFLLTSITGAMQWTDLGELVPAMDFFKATVSDEESLSKFNEEYQAWSKLSKGAPMYDFVGKDLEGNTVSSKDFRGKYLYVDIWATWCGPCKYEIPFLKELEADYHDRNIVFLSYSIDEDKDAWLEFVPKEELGGVQIIGEAAWESELCKNYKIRGVPTFMFFDPEGKIISVKMTRPSDQKTRDTFDSYSDL